MDVVLPEDVKISIAAAISGGWFASVDDALAEAWRQFQQQGRSPLNDRAKALSPDPLIGSMRDYAEEMDEIVAEAMRQREEPWRTIDLE